MKHLTVAVVSPSPMITAGLTRMLGSLRDPSVSVVAFEGLSRHGAIDSLLSAAPSMVIAEPVCLGSDDLERLRSRSRVVALCVGALPDDISRCYDDTLSVYASQGAVKRLIDDMASDAAAADSRQDLSPRERDVVVGIVKGLSNKEIAAAINVSVNTVMTHRRNIAAKLHIHSPAGLTIYAIVKKLVRLDEIRATIDA